MLQDLVNHIVDTMKAPAPKKEAWKPNSPAEELLKQIVDMLFPPTELRHGLDPETQEPFKWLVEYSADMNLEAALLDLEEGHNDAPVHNTIRDITNRLIEVRKLLDVHMELDPEARYIMVESVKENDEG